MMRQNTSNTHAHTHTRTHTRTRTLPLSLSFSPSFPHSLFLPSPALQLLAASPRTLVLSRVLQCVAGRCSVLHCTAAPRTHSAHSRSVTCVVMRCSALQCDTVHYCSMSLLHALSFCQALCSVLQHAAVRCSALSLLAPSLRTHILSLVCCSALQCAAVRRRCSAAPLALSAHSALQGTHLQNTGAPNGSRPVHSNKKK